MNLDGVLFDLGGVVLGSPLHAVADFEREHGLSPGFLNRVVADRGEEGAWACHEKGEIDFATFSVRFAEECAAEGAAVDVAALMAQVEGAAVPRPEMLRAVEKVRAVGLRVGALTNNWERLDTALGEELGPHFDVMVESMREGLRKPDPRFYLLACERLGTEPGRTAFLDDIGRNLKAARALGMTTIRVHDSDQARRDLGALLGLDLL